MAGCPKPVDVELTILSARDLKNVNWRYGGLRPHAVAWVDPEHKVSTRVDPEGDTNPSWDEKITIPGSNPKSYGGSYCNEVPPVGSSLGPYSAGSAPPASYDAEAEEPKSSEFGLGTRLAVGVVAGFVEGLTSDFDDAEDNIEGRTVGVVAGFWGGLVSDVIDHAEDKIADRTVGAVAGFVEDFVSDVIDDAEDEIEDRTVGAVAGFVKGLVSDVIDHAEDEIEDTAAERVEDNLGYDHGNSGEDDHGNGSEDDHGNVNGSEDDNGNGGEDDHGNGNGSEDDHGNGSEDDHGNDDDDY